MNTLFQELTFEEFLERTEKPGRECNCWSGRVNDWHGTRTYTEAVNLLHNGWAEGAKLMTKSQSRELPDTDAFGFTAVHSECGSEVDVGRYLAGEPECMVDWNIQRIKAPGRIASIALNATVSSGFTQEDFQARGVSALKLIDTLESSGIRCEVLLLQCSRIGEAMWCMKVCIKEPEQPLDLDRMAFMLMHVSIYRRFVFRLLEQLPENYFQTFASTGGTPADFPAQHLQPNTIVVPKLLLSDRGEIERWVQSTLAKYLEPEAQAA